MEILTSEAAGLQRNLLPRSFFSQYYSLHSASRPKQFVSQNHRGWFTCKIQQDRIKPYKSLGHR